MTAAKGRPIQSITTPVETMEGKGVAVRRALPSQHIPYSEVDPFLLLDDFTTEPGGAGIPEHPHRGQEIITYVLTGKVQHGDSTGNRAIAHAGGLQRITAGRGILHEEGPIEGEPDPVRGLQLWINMAHADKGADPGYQNLEAYEIPVEHAEGSTVHVLVGDGSPTQLHTPVFYLDVHMEPHAHFTREVPYSFQGFAYLLEGEGIFGCQRQPGHAGELLVLGPGSELEVMTTSIPVRFVLAGGKPHHEPVRWQGPFVD